MSVMSAHYARPIKLGLLSSRSTYNVRVAPIETFVNSETREIQTSQSLLLFTSENKRLIYKYL